MLDQIEIIFDNMTGMMKKLKKVSYRKNMEIFQEKNGHFFQEMIQYTEQSTNKDAAADEIAERFTGAVWDRFSKNGKIRSTTQVDLNLFVIYYVFPSILLTGSDDATLIADHIRDAWAAKFKDSNIQYADYDKIYGSFREKIFGMF